MSDEQTPHDEPQPQQQPARELSPSDALDIPPVERGREVARTLIDEHEGDPNERLRQAMKEVQGMRGQAEHELQAAKRRLTVMRHAEEIIKQVGRERHGVEQAAVDLHSVLSACSGENLDNDNDGDSDGGDE